MWRRGAVAFLLIVVAGAVVLVVRGADQPRPLLGSTGFQNREAVAFLDNRGDTACQGPVQVADGTSAVTWVFNTRRRPGPPLRIEARAAGASRVLAAARVAPGYGDGPKTMALPGIPSDELVDLCVTNLALRPLDIYGDKTGLFNNATVTLDATAQDTPGGAFLQWRGDTDSNLLARFPAALRNAAVWLPAPLGAWTLWALVALVVLGGPLLLVLGVRAAGRRA